MEPRSDAIRRSKQRDAEIDALMLLWTGTISTFTPERSRFECWLQSVGYIEMAHCVNDTVRAFIRYHRLMFPRQLIAFTDRAVSRTSTRLKHESQKIGLN